MWKLKAAAAFAPSIGSGSSEKYGKYVHWAGFIAAGLLFVLGLIGSLFDTLWVGIYCLLASLPVIILELPFTPVGFMVTAINFFSDWRFRAAFYGLLSLLAFFSWATCLAALSCLVVAGGCLWCWFKKEKKIVAKKMELCGSSSEGEVQDVETANSKRMKSLASTDETQ